MFRLIRSNDNFAEIPVITPAPDFDLVPVELVILAGDVDCFTNYTLHL